jgi:hypothetical protein
MIKDTGDHDRPPANSTCLPGTPWSRPHAGPNSRVRVLIGEVVGAISLGSFFAQEIASGACVPVPTAGEAKQQVRAVNLSPMADGVFFNPFVSPEASGTKSWW